jgi:uncharacterized protein (DUF1697 family)
MLIKIQDMHYIALLRGINVSGKNKLAMPALRALCELLGWQAVQSYIQSGNLRFEASRPPDADDLSLAIKQQYGYEVPVLLKKQDYFLNALNNPFLEETPDIDLKSLHVTFLAAAPKEEKIQELHAKDHRGDRFIVVEDRVYLHCSKGYGRTKLTNRYLENNLERTATTRNWRSLNKLAHWT